MEKERIKLIPTVYLILVKGDKTLLLRRYNTGFEDGKYSLVAGHLDHEDETLTQAMAREAREEVGVKIEPAELELVHVMHRKQQKPDERRINFFFRLEKWKKQPRIMEPDKCDDLRWFVIDDLAENTISYVKQAIACFRDNQKYSEFGW